MPVAGYFQIRMVKRGPWIPARIIHKDDLWQAEVDGLLLGTPAYDWVHAEGIDRIWHYGQFIDEGAYRYLLALKAWAEKHQPDHPSLHPTRPIDPAQLRPISA